MHLISPLAAGVAGAENGSVAIYRRGTTTRATVYEDFEATASYTPSANVDLDSNGRVIRYVNELVECFVYDSGGALVCQFTPGDQATAVEVRSQSFLGASYETGATAPGYPTTAGAIFDLWKATTGATGWKVLVGGVDITLQSALSAVGGVFFNVQASTYGAAGNGVADDTTACQAAITACAAAGGGIVWFPEGTYRTTATLSLPDKVSLWGPGAHCTTITIDHATTHCLAYAGATTRVWQELVGLRLLASQANTGMHVVVLDGTLLRMSGCDVGSVNTNGQAVALATSTTTRVAIDGCTLTCGDGGTALPFNMDGAAKRVSITNTVFIAPATMSGPALCRGNNMDIARCRFDFTSLTTGTVYGVYTNSTTPMNITVTQCTFTADGGGATTTAMYLGTLSAGSRFYEDGNTILCDTWYNYAILATAVAMQVWLGTRRTRRLVVSNSLASYNAATDQYGEFSFVTDVAGTTTITPVLFPPGNTCTFHVRNNDGTNRTLALASPATTDASETVVAGAHRIIHMSIVQLTTDYYIANDWSSF